MGTIEVLEHYLSDINPKEIPELIRQRKEWSISKPLTGISILHNVPVTKLTVYKILILIEAGATVTVTQYKGLTPKKDADFALREAKVNYYPNQAEVKGTFDYALDCSAQILDMPNVEITSGFIELTQTGDKPYQLACKGKFANHFVMSVNIALLKCLETICGTGEAFVRAFKNITKEFNLEGKLFVVNGFGNVGKGIAEHLKKEKAKIVIIEKDPAQIKLARSRSYEVVVSEDKTSIKKAVKDAFCIVSATGQLEVLSKTLTSQDVSKETYIANMGAENEIGSNFNHARVLAEKRTLNFEEEEPTLFPYLAPVFRAHNEAVKMLVESKKNLRTDIKKGFQGFPEKEDKEMLAEWKNDHPEINISRAETLFARVDKASEGKVSGMGLLKLPYVEEKESVSDKRSEKRM